MCARSPRAGGVRAVAARWWAKPLPAEPLSAVEAPPKAGAVRAGRSANGCFVGGMRGLCTDLQATRETSSEELVSARYGRGADEGKAGHKTRKALGHDTTRRTRHDTTRNFLVAFSLRDGCAARCDRHRSFLASTHTALVSQSLVGLCFAFLSIYLSSCSFFQRHAARRWISLRISRTGHTSRRRRENAERTPEGAPSVRGPERGRSAAKMAEVNL